MEGEYRTALESGLISTQVYFLNANQRLPDHGIDQRISWLLFQFFEPAATLLRRIPFTFFRNISFLLFQIIFKEPCRIPTRGNAL